MLGLVLGLAAASDVPEWTLIGAGKDGSFYALSEDIVIGEHYGQRGVQLWTKFVKADHSYSVVLDSVDCPDGSYLTLQGVEYTAAGTVRQSWEGDGQREYAVPDGYMAFLMNTMLCASVEPLPESIAAPK
jgi:hypothetical protein